jgi:alcohol dehydrogenase
LNGGVQPGGTVAIVGAGPSGLATLHLETLWIRDLTITTGLVDTTTTPRLLKLIQANCFAGRVASIQSLTHDVATSWPPGH